MPDRARRHGSLARVVLIVAALTSAGCGARRISLPTDAGAPLQDFQAAAASATEACRGVRTLTAELSLSGRAGPDRVPRATIEAGFKQPSMMRLDMRGPIGPTVATLGANGASATLILNRERRFISSAGPAEILGALIGVTLEPADLLAMLTGCVAPAPAATAGRRHGNGWASIDLQGGDTLYLAPAGGGWRVRAGQRAGWRVEYPGWTAQSMFPPTVVLSSSTPVVVEIRTTVSELATNADLDDEPFTVTPPREYDPVTLDELRETGPLRSR